MDLLSIRYTGATLKNILIAVGGNALLKKGESPDFETHMKNAKATASLISKFIKKEGHKVILTHGNGPQVGDELIRNKHASRYMPSLPLHILTAETQAYIGSILAYSMDPLLKDIGMTSEVIVTHAVVRKDDPAIANPSKQIGPYYSKAELEKELKFRKFSYVKEKGSYRMVVPSPKPVSVLEMDAIRESAKQNRLVICGGGGGIPVLKSGKWYKGFDGVIDKDATSALIAVNVNVDELIILTEAEALYGNFPDRSSIIREINVRDAKALLGRLENGTIRPKLEACIRFASSTGRIARIGALEKLEEISAGRSGTAIRP